MTELEATRSWAVDCKLEDLTDVIFGLAGHQLNKSTPPGAAHLPAFIPFPSFQGLAIVYSRFKLCFSYPIYHTAGINIDSEVYEASDTANMLCYTRNGDGVTTLYLHLDIRSRICLLFLVNNIQVIDSIE